MSFEDGGNPTANRKEQHQEDQKRSLAMYIVATSHLWSRVFIDLRSTTYRRQTQDLPETRLSLCSPSVHSPSLPTRASLRGTTNINYLRLPGSLKLLGENGVPSFLVFARMLPASSAPVPCPCPAVRLPNAPWTTWVGL